MKIIDLFCGAGGFSLGAHLAGFQTALAVDKDRVLTSSFQKNFPGTNLLLSDLAVTKGSTLLKEAGIIPDEDFGLIGGPPCQGFSLMGKRSSTDPRNELLNHFFRLVKETKPKFFVMENVPGILLDGSRELLGGAILRLSGYSIVGPVKVNASDFGAATNRERVVVVGFRGKSLLTLADIEAAKVLTAMTVYDAIRDLPAPHQSGEAAYKKVEVISAYALYARSPVQSLGSALGKERLLAGKVSGLQPTSHTEKVVIRFGTVAQGKSDSVSRCPRLLWGAPGPTLRAGTGPDHGSFQSIRPIHPEQPRVITVREAARLQGFPDWFEFHKTKWHSFRMIGNSVSPPLSKALLTLIAKGLRAAHDEGSGKSDKASYNS